MSKNSVSQEIQELPQVGLVRIKTILKCVEVSRSNWWAGVKSGRYPQPFKLSERVTVWKATDIRALVEGIQPSALSISKTGRQGGESC